MPNMCDRKFGNPGISWLGPH